MDRATTSAILGTVLGLAAGILGMYFLGARDAGDRTEELSARIAQAEGDHNALKGENADLRAEIDRLRRDAGAAHEIADEFERLAKDKADAVVEARELKEELRALKGAGSESGRQAAARIEQLQALLEKYGIYDHLSPEEIKARLAMHKSEFETAFATKDKKALLDSLWQLQKLGPAAYDTAIELWRMAAADYGLNPFGQGPKTLGLTFQEYVSLISSFGLIEKGLTDPAVAMDFRIASLYSLPWWSSESAEARARLAGDALKSAKGYEITAALEALRDIPDPQSVRYLSEFLAGNTDNAAARSAAINSLAVKNTPQAWAAIEHAAQHDPDESVRKAAQNRLATRNPGVEGVMITWVGADSQGALAGIKVGDVLTHYNGERVRTLEDVNKAKLAVGEDQTVTVLVRRGSEDLSLQLGPGMIGINGTAVAPK